MICTFRILKLTWFPLISIPSTLISYLVVNSSVFFWLYPIFLETSNTVLKFAIYSVLELFNKTTGEDFNSIAGGIILSKLVSAKMVRVKELGPSHHTNVFFFMKPLFKLKILVIRCTEFCFVSKYKCQLFSSECLRISFNLFSTKAINSLSVVFICLVKCLSPPNKLVAQP